LYRYLYVYINLYNVEYVKYFPHFVNIIYNIKYFKGKQHNWYNGNLHYIRHLLSFRSDFHLSCSTRNEGSHASRDWRILSSKI